jgi:predicted DNA-binding transcriptional regulator AlpA
MESENDVPHFLRLRDLQERGIAMTYQAVRHMQEKEGFPLGRLLGPGTRVWTHDEINQWLASRPVSVSEQAKRRAQRSIEARGFKAKQEKIERLPTARQLLDQEDARAPHCAKEMSPAQSGGRR